MPFWSDIAVFNLVLRYAVAMSEDLCPSSAAGRAAQAYRFQTPRKFNSKEKNLKEPIVKTS